MNKDNNLVIALMHITFFEVVSVNSQKISANASFSEPHSWMIYINVLYILDDNS